MRKIGETSGGTMIIEMNKADWVFLGRIAEVCTGAAEPPYAAPVVELKPAPAAAPTKVQKPAAKPASAGEHKAKCVVCGSPFHRKTSQVCCSEKCKTEREQAQKRAYAQKVTTPARQEKREERGLTKEARKEMLMAAARRMGIAEKDPVQALVDKAGGTVDGD